MQERPGPAAPLTVHDEPGASVRICTSQDHTSEGGASMVVAIVELVYASVIRSSPGYVAETSSRVAPQVVIRGRTATAYPTAASQPDACLNLGLPSGSSP